MLGHSIKYQIILDFIEVLSSSAIILFALIMYTPIFITLIIDEYFNSKNKN